MIRETLLDFFADFAEKPDEFLVHDDGYRSRSYRYRDVALAARLFSARLRSAGIGKAAKVVFWSENRPEWIAALWGCLLEGVIAVPVDYRSSIDMVRRIYTLVGARALLTGEEVSPPSDLAVWRLADLQWTGDAPAPSAAVERDDIAEILFTSGTTAEPKGVLITHRNVLANIVPVEREVARYRKYSWPFAPIRFLNLLPLSHMFGQAMATFIPPMLPGVTMFIHGYNPQEIARQIHRRRISVLVCVPRILEVMREYVLQAAPESARPGAGKPHWLVRWWLHRKIHRLFGWKFWAFVVGAAPLEPELEQFWSRLGFLVIQGYGLTETAPIVTLNHPFHARGGTVGKPIAGVEVRIADDGEILVRGENVTSGYFNAGGAALEDGWLHTGDIGSLDAEGRLSVRGRKKELIVTPEGLNVFPEDVERVLDRQPGVRESAVVGHDRVQAALVVETGADVDQIVCAANAQLEQHQKIRDVAIWPAAALPRTEGTGKLKRVEVARWIENGARPPAEPAGDNLESIVARYARNRAVRADTTLDELGLSSLERVELMLAIEQKFGASVDESQFTAARTIADLRTAATSGAAVRPEPIVFPSWNRSGVAKLVRSISLATWILPIARIFAWVRAQGREHLRTLDGPAIFAANHQSHLDTIAILLALPARWRYKIAPAMAKEFFKAHFFPAQYGRAAWFTSSLNYYLSTLFFNAFPFPQRETGLREALRHAGDLVSQGCSILIFPEGRRSETGAIDLFRPGVGILASKLEIPVVPVRIEGADRVLKVGWNMARPGRVVVTFGEPIMLRGEDYVQLARKVEEAVREL